MIANGTYSLLPRFWVKAGGRFFPLGHDLIRAISVDGKLYSRYPRMSHGVCSRTMVNLEF